MGDDKSAPATGADAASEGSENAPVPAFDFSAMQNLLNDPSIRTMAEQIAEDPAFAQLTKTLQSSLAGQGGEAAAAGAEGALVCNRCGFVWMPA